MDAAAYSQAPPRPWNPTAMATAQPPRDDAAPAAPRTLRLLERAAPPRRLPPPAAPAVWSTAWPARLGRWVDRLLAS